MIDNIGKELTDPYKAALDTVSLEKKQTWHFQLWHFLEVPQKTYAAEVNVFKIIKYNGLSLLIGLTIIRLLPLKRFLKFYRQ